VAAATTVDDGGKADCGGHFRIGSQPTQVSKVSNRNTADACLFGLLNGYLGGELRRDLAEGAETVNLGGSRRFGGYRGCGIRDNRSLLYLLDVLDNPDETVGIVARQVVVGQVLGNRPRMLVGGSGGAEYLMNDPFYFLRCYCGHWTFSFWLARDYTAWTITPLAVETQVTN